MRIFTAIFCILISAAAANAATKPASPFSTGDSKAPIAIEADSLEVLQEQRKAIFSGNVVAKQSKMDLRADKMTVYYSGADTSGKSISKIDVDGNVFLSTGTETARGSNGNYDVVNDFVVLTGNVILTRQNNVLKGNKLEYDIKNGQSKLLGGVTTTSDGKQTGGRVQGLFVPEEKGQGK